MDLAASDLIAADLPRVKDTASAGSVAISRFSAELFASLSKAHNGNLVCSPYSVAVALGMTVQGARGSTAEQILDVLHVGEASVLADGLNAIDLALATRSGAVPGGDPSREIELAAANSLWGQRGLQWERPFLEVLARDFGTGIRVVDYRQDTEAARSAVNDWVSQQTHARIPELVPAGAFRDDTRLTLVNALYFRAPWRTPFLPGMTQKALFHRVDGPAVTVDLMGGSGNRFASGPGWVAADLPYARGELAMAIVVPEVDRFAEVEKSLTSEWLDELLTGLAPMSVDVGLPRWTHRSQVGLRDTLAGMGMPIAFTDAADFRAMTTDEPLTIAAVVHEGFIAVDEAGTEAAAATAVMARTTGFIRPSRSVVADRPFLYVIHDLPTRTPIFVGRVMDPTTG